MEAVVLVLHLILAVSLVAVVLLQRSEGGGLGIGGGSAGGGLISVRGQANLLTRVTAVLAASFMVTSITLAILAGAHSERRSILDRPGPLPTQEVPAPQQPAVPLSQ